MEQKEEKKHMFENIIQIFGGGVASWSVPEFLRALAQFLHELFAWFGVLVMSWGVIRAIIITGKGIFTSRILSPVSYKQSRQALCQHLMIGLDAMVIGDMIGTVSAYQIEQLYLVALLVVIRTVISYSIERELKEINA